MYRGIALQHDCIRRTALGTGGYGRQHLPAFLMGNIPISSLLPNLLMTFTSLHARSMTFRTLISLLQIWFGRLLIATWDITRRTFQHHLSPITCCIRWEPTACIGQGRTYTRRTRRRIELCMHWAGQLSIYRVGSFPSVESNLLETPPCTLAIPGYRHLHRN
jgi:hypothetical protein